MNVAYKLAEQEGDIRICIKDVSGKIVYDLMLSSNEDIVLIDIAQIPPGTYICSLYNGNDCDFSEKFVKNK